MRTTLVLAVGVLGVAGLSACGDDGSDAGGGRASIVVTTNIVGDVVEQLVGDDVDVEVVMPPNASPHDFAPSARQAAAMREADVLVVNGLGFEEGLQDTVDAAEDDGVPVLALAEYAPDPLGEDPHVFADPARMAFAVEVLATRLEAAIPELGTGAYHLRVDAYISALEALDAEVEDHLSAIPPERRVLVTNHEVLGYFADRYGFEVLGAVIPSLSTLAEPSAADLADLADAITDAHVPAIFAETSSPTRLAQALAAEGVDVEVVELYGESLGEAGSGAATYVDMVRTNARRIAQALGAAS